TRAPESSLSSSSRLVALLALLQPTIAAVSRLSGLIDINRAQGSRLAGLLLFLCNSQKRASSMRQGCALPINQIQLSLQFHFAHRERHNLTTSNFDLCG